MIIQITNSFLIFSLIKQIRNLYINDLSYKEALKSKSIYDNSDLINNNIFKYSPQTKLFFSENKNKYIELSEVSNTSTNYQDIINNSSFYEIPESIISRYEKRYQREKIDRIIRTIESNKANAKNNNNNNNNNKNNNDNNSNGYFSDKYSFYGNKKLISLDYSYYWNKLISKNSIINDLSSSPIKELISTEPEQIYIEQKICFPVSKLFYINNPDTEDNLLIRDIKSDLHQVKIFPYLSKDYIKTKGNSFSSINSYYPYSIFPQSKFVFQLLILPDIADKVSGNLYIKFNDKKVLIIPITIIGLENEYKIKPIYYMNWQINKKLILPIKITNPSKKKLLIIKDIIHSFKKISLEWPNGMKVSNNYTSFIPSMLHIWPKDSKNILFIKYFSEKVTNEYGFIHLKTDDDDLIVIPVLINVKNYSLNTFPGFINFGLCDLAAYNRKNFVKMVPLLVMNYGNEDVEVKRIYLDYDDKFIHFHKKFKNQNKIIIKKNSHNQFGYILFDGEYAVDKDENKFIGKIQRGSVLIETNSTIDPLLEIEYFYLTDYNKIIKIVSGDVQNITRKNKQFTFDLLVKFRPPPNFVSSLGHLVENSIIYKESYYNAQLVKITKEDQESYLLTIHFDMKKLENFYHRYVYVPLAIGPKIYTIFPIEIDNNNINLIFCNYYSDEASLPLCIKPYGGFNKYNVFKMQYLLISTQFHFGSIDGEINRKKYLFIINDNLSPVIINNIKSSNNYFTLDFENSYSINNNNTILNFDYFKKEVIQVKKDSNQCVNYQDLNYEIQPKTALLLSLNIMTKNKNNKTLLEGDIYLSFNNNSGITISNKVNILIGDFSISPSNIKFEPAFPGLVQSKIIFCKNTYKLSLDIISVTSNDNRIIPILLTKKVEPELKTPIIKILFKPGMNSLIKDYIPEIDMKKSLTYRELYLWKKNEEYWNELGQKGKTEINANITVITGLKTKVINVRSFLIRPNLVKKEEINYGLIQVGKTVQKFVEVYNPSDSALEIKLFLAPDYYDDINNSSMFSLKEQKELFLDKNNVVIMLGCSFIISQNESLKNFFEYIIINENIDLENSYKNSMNKEELFKKLYYYGNAKVKKYLYNSINVLCHYEKKYKNIFSIKQNDENKYLMSEIFSPDFNKEIEIIKNMSNCDFNPNKNSQNSSTFGNIFRFFAKIFKFFIFIFKKDDLPNIQIEESKQSFYLHHNSKNDIYMINPHQKVSVGPIYFKPNTTGKITNVLLLKNNLTILHPIKLRGEGGSGQLTFMNYYENMKNKKTEIFNNTNFIIEINSDIYQNKMKSKKNLIRAITINNSGNLPLMINNITIDNNDCQTDDLKIVQCKEFFLDMGESIVINFDININLLNEITKRVVKFNTDYQVFELNVIIIISKELFEQKRLYWKMLKIILLIFIPAIIAFVVFKKMLIVDKIVNKKKEIPKINNSHIENRPIINNEIKNEESENKKIYGKKKGKNKKNRKIEKNEKDREIKKVDKINVIDKYFKKKVIETPEDNKIDNFELNNKNKTFGVIRLNNKSITENNNNDSLIKNETQKIIEKDDKDKKVRKISKKKSKINNEYNDDVNEEKINSKNTSKKDENIISSNDNNNDNKKIISSNSNINNNINIKININLNSKEEEDVDNDDSSKLSNENNNSKLIEANIIQKNISNTNNNYNYDIKINNNNIKTNNNNIKIRTKNKQSKKVKNKKVSNLNELFGITPKKKIDKAKEEETEVIKKKESDNITKNLNEEIFGNYKNETNKEKQEDEKKIENNTINNENITNKNEEEQKDNISLEDDFDDLNFGSTDFFNSIFKKDSNETNEDNGGDYNENEDEDDDYDNCGLFGKQILNSLYENPFCTNEKKGNLDELLKK